VEQAASNLTAKFFGNGRRPECSPNPNYPMGITFDASLGAPGCSVALTYPAPECGMWYVHCARCGSNAVVTAASRPDDPHTVKLPCHPTGSA
jgi:hypothetical protein